MIDRIFYALFSWLDDQVERVNDLWTYDIGQELNKRKNMRDNKAIENFLKSNYKKIVEMSLFRNLKKEVEIGANGTQDYIIKKGINKDKLAKKL